MTRLVAVDTNVLLRATVKEAGLEQAARAARRILEDDGCRCLISDVAIAEYVHALDKHYRFSRPVIAEFTAGIVNLDSAACSRAIVLKALAQYVRKPGLSFEDCFLAEHAAAHGARPLWTFDKKLAQRHKNAREVS